MVLLIDDWQRPKLVSQTARWLSLRDSAVFVGGKSDEHMFRLAGRLMEFKKWTRQNVDFGYNTAVMRLQERKRQVEN